MGSPGERAQIHPAITNGIEKSGMREDDKMGGRDQRDRWRASVARKVTPSSPLLSAPPKSPFLMPEGEAFDKHLHESAALNRNISHDIALTRISTRHHCPTEMVRTKKTQDLNIKIVREYCNSGLPLHTIEEVDRD